MAAGQPNQRRADVRRCLFVALAATSAIAMLAPIGARASATGGVRAWGSNNFGQLGLETDAADALAPITGNPTNNSRVASPVPLPVKAFIGATVNDLAAGTYHSLALRSDATVAGWGDNSEGQLGNACALPCGSENAPVVVSGLSSVLDVAGGGRHSLAVKDNGTSDEVWAWGAGAAGQLGDGCDLTETVTTASDYCGSESTPLQVRTNAMPNTPTYLTSATAVAAGSRHSVALKSDGTVWAWGENNFGQLGNAATTSSTFAVQVKTGASTNLTGVTAIAAGGNHGLALKSDGTVWAWGANDAGQLGNASVSDSNVAVQVKTGASTNLTGVVSIAAGSAHSLAVKDEVADTVWAWGANESGQLGDTTTAGRDVAVQVKTGPTTALTGALAVSAGGLHSLAIIDTGLAVTADDAVWSWGRNLEGQLGHGTTGVGLAPAANSTRAQPVVGLAGATRVAGGGLHSLAFVP